MEGLELTKEKAKTPNRVGVIWKKFEWFTDQLAIISGFLTVIMTVAVMREVIGRYLFNEPSDWSLELSCYLVVTLGYLAAASTQLAGSHVRVDMFYLRFPQKIKNYLNIFIYLICLTWSSILVKQGWELAYSSYIKDAHSSEAMMWPLFPSQIMVPIGSFFISLIFIGLIIKSIHTVSKGGK